MLLYYNAGENVEYPSIPADIMKGSDFFVMLINIIKTKIKLHYLLHDSKNLQILSYITVLFKQVS